LGIVAAKEVTPMPLFVIQALVGAALVQLGKFLIILCQ
jgi:hypothetical protein